MATLPEWIGNVPAVSKWITGTIAGIAATVAGWSTIGGPVPASRQWVVEHIDQREAQEQIRTDIARLETLVDKTENEEVREGLERQLADVRSRLDDDG